MAKLSKSQRVSASEKIVEHVTQFITAQPGIDSIAVYAAHGAEVDLASIHNFLPSKKLLYPLCGSGHSLSFHQVDDPSTLKAGMLGIREPDAAVHPLVSVGDIDCFLCPGLAFSRDGYRLGQGGGYYDRLLAKKRIDAPAIGIGYSMQMLESLPHEKHDVKLSATITDLGFNQGDLAGC